MYDKATSNRSCPGYDANNAIDVKLDLASLQFTCKSVKLHQAKFIKHIYSQKHLSSLNLHCLCCVIRAEGQDATEYQGVLFCTNVTE